MVATLSVLLGVDVGQVPRRAIGCRVSEDPLPVRTSLGPIPPTRPSLDAFTIRLKDVSLLILSLQVVVIRGRRGCCLLVLLGALFGVPASARTAADQRNELLAADVSLLPGREEPRCCTAGRPPECRNFRWRRQTASTPQVETIGQSGIRSWRFRCGSPAGGAAY